MIHKFEKSLFSVKLVICIRRFGNTVGIQEESISRCKHKLTCTVTDTLHTGKHKARASLKILKGTVGTLQKWRIVSGVCKLHISCFEIENTHPGCNEHSGFVVFAKLFVCTRKYFIYGYAALREILDDRFCRHHEHCGGNSLTRNVRNEKSNSRFIKLIVIVEISANLFCRDHLCKYAIILIVGEVCGERRELNLLCVFKLLVDTSRCFRNIALESGNSRVDIIRQGRELLARTHVNRYVKVSLGDATKCVVDLFKIIYNNPLYEDIDKHEQCCKNNDLHEDARIKRCITHKGCLSLGH